MSASAATPGAAARVSVRRRRGSDVDLLRSALRLPVTRVGLSIVTVLVLLAILGPWAAPHSPTEFVGRPFAGPSSTAWFGTDVLGRDVLSRFLHGGRSVIGMSVSSTLLGVSAGTLVGLIAAYSGGVLDSLVMRTSDVLLAFPQIVLVLLLVAGAGSSWWIVVLAVALTVMPRTARVMRGAALEITEREFIRAAEAIGESRRRILLGQLLPNITGPLMVELGLRLTYAVALVAGLSFLGLGLQPPQPDWGLMINENRIAIVTQPWAVLLPVAAIGLLTVGTNLTTDGIARAYARSEPAGRAR